MVDVDCLLIFEEIGCGLIVISIGFGYIDLFFVSEIWVGFVCVCVIDFIGCLVMWVFE